MTPPLPTMTRNARNQQLYYRSDTCKRGHSLADAYVNKDGWRKCRACRRKGSSAYEDARERLEAI